jgi:hypothetical protein
MQEKLIKKAEHLVRLIRDDKIKHPAVKEILEMLNNFLEYNEKYIGEIEFDNFGLIQTVNSQKYEIEFLKSYIEILNDNKQYDEKRLGELYNILGQIEPNPLYV